MIFPADGHNWVAMKNLGAQQVIYCLDCHCEGLIEAATSKVQCYRDSTGHWLFPDEPIPPCSEKRGMPPELCAPYGDTAQPGKLGHDPYAAMAAELFTQQPVRTDHDAIHQRARSDEEDGGQASR